MPATDEYDVLIQKRDAIAILTLNRPDKLNALRRKTFAELSSHLQEIQSDPRVGCLIITAAGKAFSAGADIFEYGEMKSIHDFIEFTNFGNKLYDSIVASEKPVIAAVNGYALGGGFELALACDIIVASENATFGLPEIKIGLIPGGGGTQRLPALVGSKVARELLMTGDSITAQEAHRLNIVSDVVAPERLMEESEALATKIAGMSRRALAAIKRLVNMSASSSADLVLPYERLTVASLYETDEAKARIKEFVDKRRKR